MFKAIVIVGLVTIGLASPANAQGYYRGHRGGGGWVAPFVGGAILGGIVGGIMTAPRLYEPNVVVNPPMYVPTCWDEVIGYTQWGNPIVRRICR